MSFRFQLLCSQNTFLDQVKITLCPKDLFPQQYVLLHWQVYFYIRVWRCMITVLLQLTCKLFNGRGNAYFCLLLCAWHLASWLTHSRHLTNIWWISEHVYCPNKDLANKNWQIIWLAYILLFPRPLEYLRSYVTYL